MVWQALYRMQMWKGVKIMTEWETCYDGCRCSECRQRRSDYFFMQDYRSIYGIEGEYSEDTTLNRLDNAMDNLNYDAATKKALRKRYLHE